MKYYTFIILIIIFLLLPSSVSCFDEDRDSTLLIQNDSAANSEIDSSEKGIDLIAIGGLGIVTGGLGSNMTEFTLAPAIGFGIEIPFHSIHIAALELYGHYWVSECHCKHNDYCDFDDVYTKIGKNTYSQWGVSAALKIYFMEKKTKFRISIHMGCLFISPNTEEYRGFDIGAGLHYVMNENWDISLSYRMIISNLDMGGGGSGSKTPNLLMFNMCYKFRLGK